MSGLSPVVPFGNLIASTALTSKETTGSPIPIPRESLINTFLLKEASSWTYILPLSDKSSLTINV